MAERPRPIVEALTDDARLDEPLFAVNLLRRVRPWAYDLYNVLAYPVARSVGARPLLKGTGGRRVAGVVGPESAGPESAGPESAGHDGAGVPAVAETLLIVGYPDGTSFLKMALHPWFLLVSALRRYGFEDFRFGFTRRFDGGPSHPSSSKSGLLLALFWPLDAALDGQGGDSQQAAPDLAELRRRVSAAGSTLVFAGSLKARMAIERGQGPQPTRMAPQLPYGHIVVVTGHERTLTPLAQELPAGAVDAALFNRSF